MAKKYLVPLAELLDKATVTNVKNSSLECKHFFSGAAVYVNGKICMSLTPAGFALKLPEKLRNKLLQEKRVTPLRYFSKAPIKKDYVVLPERMLNNTKIFRYWVKKSIEYVK